MSSPFDQKLIAEARRKASIAAAEIAARAKEVADRLNKSANSIRDKKLRQSVKIYTGED
jgi:hypothetical protein